MRLIDADRFDKELDESEEYASLELSVEIFRTKVRLATQPTIDAEPVRHGHWKGNGKGYWEIRECSVCGEKMPTVGGLNYCPNCGAKMNDVTTNE